MSTKDTQNGLGKSGRTLDELFHGEESLPLSNQEAQKPQVRKVQQPEGQNTAIKDTSNMVIPLEHLGETPAFIDCPYCKQRTKTRVIKEPSSQTSLAAAFCCLFCGIITVCIPFLCNWCADIEHTCSHCNQKVSHKPHDGPVQAKYPQASIATPSQYAPMPADLRSRLSLPPLEERYLGVAHSAPVTTDNTPRSINDNSTPQQTDNSDGISREVENNHTS